MLINGSTVMTPFGSGLRFGDGGAACNICLERFPLHRLFTLQCGEHTCLNCLEEYLRVTNVYRCPCTDVHHKIDEDAIMNEKRLHPVIVSNYVDRREFAEKRDFYTICHRCKALIAQYGYEFKCPNCRVSSCKSCPECNLPHPPLISCESYAKERVAFQNSIGNKSSYKTCTCGFTITRISGCPNVQCVCGRYVIVPEIEP